MTFEDTSSLESDLDRLLHQSAFPRLHQPWSISEPLYIGESPRSERSNNQTTTHPPHEPLPHFAEHIHPGLKDSFRLQQTTVRVYEHNARQDHEMGEW
jgi:hypothetical protein